MYHIDCFQTPLAIASCFLRRLLYHLPGCLPLLERELDPAAILFIPRPPHPSKAPLGSLAVSIPVPSQFPRYFVLVCHHHHSSRGPRADTGSSTMSQSKNKKGGQQTPIPLTALNLAQHGASHTGGTQASGMSTWLDETSKQGPWTAVGRNLKREAPNNWQASLGSLEQDMERTRVYGPGQARK